MKWATPASLPITTEGDLIIGDATGDAVRLPIGALGTVLTSDGDTADWATPAGGGQTQIATGSLTGSTVNITSIPGTYRDLKLVISNFLPATDNAQMFLRFNGDSSTYARGTGLDLINLSFTESAAVLSNSNDNGAGNNKGMNIATISEYANTTMWKSVFTTTLTQNGSSPSNLNYSYYFGFWNKTTAITEINLICSTGSFTSGTYTLYGVK